jgi:hypothetical protein
VHVRVVGGVELVFSEEITLPLSVWPRGIGKLDFEHSFDHSAQLMRMISGNHKIYVDRIERLGLARFVMRWNDRPQSLFLRSLNWY